MHCGTGYLWKSSVRRKKHHGSTTKERGKRKVWFVDSSGKKVSPR